MTSMKILLYKLVLPKSGKGNTVEPEYYGHLGTRKKCYDGVLIFQVILKEMFHLGPQQSVWIMQVSIFSSVQVSLYDHRNGDQGFDKVLLYFAWAR